jgi:hypothetical protein
MDDNLENEFFNLEFRILVAEEAIQDVQKRATALLSDIQDWKKKYATATSDDEEYWKAD